jgi:uncharacterized protein YciI
VTLKRLLLAAALALPLAGQSTATYQIVFLRPAPDRKAVPKEEMDRILTAHMANIHAMADRGVLVVAGPFEDTPATISGVFVMNTSRDEALRIASGDPTVTAHRNTVDVMTWTGPKGVGEEYRRLHASDPKTPDDMGVHPFVLLRTVPSALPKELAASGPLTGNAEFHYLLIFKRIPDEEARRAVDSALKPEFHRWWCAAHIF